MMLVSFLQNQSFFLELVVSLVLSAFFNKKTRSNYLRTGSV